MRNKLILLLVVILVPVIHLCFSLPNYLVNEGIISNIWEKFISDKITAGFFLALLSYTQKFQTYIIYIFIYWLLKKSYPQASFVNRSIILGILILFLQTSILFPLLAPFVFPFSKALLYLFLSLLSLWIGYFVIAFFITYTLDKFLK